MSTLDPQKRFLILTGDAGFGHRSAARSVAAALKAQHPGSAEVHIINPVTERQAPSFLRQTQVNYDQTVLKNPDWYRFTYDISDNRAASSLVENVLTVMLFRNMQQLLAEFEPHAILTTINLFNAPLGSVLHLLQKPIPFFTVVTDLADVHKMWFQASPDRIFVATEAVREQALQTGIAAHKVNVSGIPVDPRLAETADQKEKAQLRLSFGLQPDLPTLLFVGSRRVAGIYECLEALQGYSRPVQVLLAAGGDEALCRRISAQTWNFPLHYENYVKDLLVWLRAADVLVTKAGGLILSEGLAASLPLVLINNLPGQEDGNVRFITENRAGVRVQNEIELLTVIEAWLSDRGVALSEMTAQARVLGHPRAAFTIADALWQATLVNPPQPRPSLPQSLFRIHPHARLG
jgi:1,2-diacylglycerol 3-beta-galactosyltransferase